MKRFSFSHLSNPSLLRTLAAGLAHERAATALVVALLAEVEARRLYAPAGYPSMVAFCVGEFHLCEQAAFKRLQAARAARRFPAILAALEEGRLHLSAVVLLAPRLTEETVAELIAAATHRSKAEIERMLADRSPRPDVPARVEEVSSCSQALTTDQLSPGIVGSDLQLSPGTVAAHVDRPRLTPLGARRFALEFTIDQATHDDLVRAQEMLSHRLPSGDIAKVFALALQALIRELEKKKFAATAKPRAARRACADVRHIPASVKHAVWERDGGQCTFVSDTGHRCASRELIEFDHVDEVARGGEASVSRIRLRCRAHNQYAAECTFGPEFMRRKREAAAEARTAAKARATADARATAEARAAAAPGAQALAAKQAVDRDVTPWLRSLRFKADELRDAAAYCESIPDLPLDQRVRAAISFLRPGRPRTGLAADVHGINASRTVPGDGCASSPTGLGAS